MRPSLGANPRNSEYIYSGLFKNEGKYLNTARVNRCCDTVARVYWGVIWVLPRNDCWWAASSALGVPLMVVGVRRP